MNTNKILKISGTTLDKNQLEQHLQKIASGHNLVNKSSKETYPVPQMVENYKVIRWSIRFIKWTLKTRNKYSPSRRMVIRQFLYNRRNSKTNSKRIAIKKI